MLPLVSIIVPVYNVEKYLETAFKSILNQTYLYCEVIVVNDGSTDSSSLIIEKYKNKIKRMKIINQCNKGLSVARNVGTSYASGKYIYYFDPDDVLNPNLVEKSVQMMEEYDLDLIQFDVNTFFDGVEYDENRVFLSYKKIQESGVYSVDNFLSKVDARLFRAPVWQFMYRKTFLEQNNLIFEPNILWEDLLFSPIAICSADRIGILKDTLYNYRIRKGSITTKKEKHEISRMKKSSQIIIKKLNNYYQALESKYRRIFIKKRIHKLLINYYRDYGYKEMDSLKKELNIHLNIYDYLRIINMKCKIY